MFFLRIAHVVLFNLNQFFFVWRGDRSLCDQSPHLFAMSNQNEASMADVWVETGSGREWRLEEDGCFW
jgi:hypothetical protein